MELYIWIIVGIAVGWVASLSRLYNFFDDDDNTVSRKHYDTIFKEKITLKNMFIGLFGSIIAGIILHLVDKKNLDFSGQVLNTNLNDRLARFDLMVVLVSMLGAIVALGLTYYFWRLGTADEEPENNKSGQSNKEKLVKFKK